MRIVLGRHRTYLMLLALTVFVWVAKYHPFLAAPLIIDDDARQHVYWTYRFQDPELFPDDLLTQFIASPKVAPPGYQALYALAVRFMDPLVFSQWLSLGLLLLAVDLLWRSGQALSNRTGGALAASLLVFYMLYSSSGGLPKSFAFPLLLGSLRFAMRQHFVGMAGLFLVQSLFYPPILLNSGALAAATWVRAWSQRPGPIIWRHFGVLLLGTLLAGFVLGSVYVWRPAPSFGRMITPTEASQMPEFGPEGRTAFYDTTPLRTLLNDRAGFGAERLYGFLAIVLLMAVLQWPGRFIIPPVVYDLLATSLVLFGLAYAVLFTLHLPSRYVLYTFPTALLLMIAANEGRTWSILSQRWPAIPQSIHRLFQRRRLCWGLLIMLATGYIWVQNCYIARVDPLTVQVQRPALRLYRYLQTLPKDVLLAGHPLEMDNIPLFARRKVLANQELSLPYFPAYYATVRQRLLDSLLAYYAADEKQVHAFVQHYGVDYILLNRQHFTPEFLSGRLYFAPFDRLVRPHLSTPPRFALLEGRVGTIVYADGPYMLVSCREL